MDLAPGFTVIKVLYNSDSLQFLQLEDILMNKFMERFIYIYIYTYIYTYI